MAGVNYRQAGLDDAAEIHDLLLRLAPEIPLLVDTLAREEALYALTRNCTRSGESWASSDPDGRIVGFLLVQPSGQGRHYAEHEILELHHGGVVPELRCQGIFTALIAKVQQRMLPIRVSVSPQNKTGAEHLFRKYGFRVTDQAGEYGMLWEPGA